MIERLKHSSIIKGKIVAGVHIIILSDGKYDIRLVLLKKKKSRINIEKKIDNINSIEDLADNIPASAPICLSIDGKGIIHKKISATENDGNKEILNKVLPNASVEDFFICRNNIDENNCYTSIIRHEITDDLFSLFKDKKRFLVSLNLGPFSINNVISFLNEKRETITANTYELSITENRISDFKKTETEGFPKMYRIGDEDILEDIIVPFSNAFAYFVSQNDEQTNKYIKEQQDEFLYRQMFVLGGWTVMILLFSVLLINYLFFDYYNKKQNELSVQVEQNQSLLNQLDTLESELKMKEDFITKSDFLKSTRQSYYADRLAGTIPKNILLTRMDIQPLKKKMKVGDTPVFKKNTIIVSGMTNSSTVFNDWIKDINTKKWISELEVLSYIRENARSSGLFEVEIIVKKTNVNETTGNP